MVGSANVDIVLPVERIPRPGETVLATGLSRGPGGKGSNQAVAAARAGAVTTFVAALGDDDSGRLLEDVLTRAGVDLSVIDRTTTPTGTAIITVDATGENSIVVAASANAELTLSAAARDVVAGAAVTLAQLEIPLPTVLAAARTARFMILNAAPAGELSDELLAEIDLLVVNEHEAAKISGVDDKPEALLDRVSAVVVTLGRAGAVVLRRDTEPVRVAGIAADVVDTTGAGDTFCGVLAASLARGHDLPAAVRRANAAASLSVEKPGAADSVPNRAAIDARYAEAYP